MDAIHLASAEAITGADMRIMTWGRRLWQACRVLGMALVPETPPDNGQVAAIEEV